jgi:hypothetical protein
VHVATGEGFWQATIGPDGAGPDDQVVITRFSLAALLAALEDLLER